MYETWILQVFYTCMTGVWITCVIYVNTTHVLDMYHTGNTHVAHLVVYAYHHDHAHLNHCQWPDITTAAVALAEFGKAGSVCCTFAAMHSVMPDWVTCEWPHMAYLNQTWPRHRPSYVTSAMNVNRARLPCRIFVHTFPCSIGASTSNAV